MISEGTGKEESADSSFQKDPQQNEPCVLESQKDKVWKDRWVSFSHTPGSEHHPCPPRIAKILAKSYSAVSVGWALLPYTVLGGKNVMFTSQFHWDTLVVLSMLKEDGSGLETDKSSLQWSCSGSSDFSVSCIKESLNKQNFFPPVVMVCHLEANSSTELSHFWSCKKQKRVR